MVRVGGFRSRAVGGVDSLCEVGERGVFEHHPRGQRQPGVAGPRGELHREDAVAAEGEELVESADLGEVEQFDEQAGQRMFGRRLRRRNRSRRCGHADPRTEQPVRRQVVDHGDDSRRDVGGQIIGQRVPHRGDEGLRVFDRMVGDDVPGEQRRTPRLPTPGRRGRDAVDRLQCGLQPRLPEGDRLEAAVRGPAGTVARAVDPSGTEGVGHEPFRRRSRRGAGRGVDGATGVVHVTDHPDAHRLGRLVEHVDVGGTLGLRQPGGRRGLAAPILQQPGAFRRVDHRDVAQRLVGVGRERLDDAVQPSHQPLRGLRFVELGPIDDGALVAGTSRLREEVERQVGMRHVERGFQCGEPGLAVGARVDDLVLRQIFAHVHHDTEQRVA